MKIHGNQILLTGATSGIGLAMLEKFYELGNLVVATSRSENRLLEIKQKFPKIEIIVCDLSKWNDVLHLAKQCKENFPNLNILIHNAGIQYNDDWKSFSKKNDEILKEVQTNYISPMILTNELLPVLSQQTEAAIIHVSSGLAFAPKQSAPIYCGTKAAIHITTKSLRYQLESTNIKVFEVIPPLVDTPMTEGRGKGKISPEALVKEFMNNLAKDRFEMNIGKTKLLRMIQRISPKFADSLLKNG